MLQEFISSKIHRATVTDANLNYVGSITIDETLLKASNIKEWQKVDILNINNGERFHTYVIKGKADSGMICLNGAAARKAQAGDSGLRRHRRGAGLRRGGHDSRVCSGRIGGGFQSADIRRQRGRRDGARHGR